MRVAFEVFHSNGKSDLIEWSRRTTDLISTCQFGSDRAIQLSEARHPDLPADAPDAMARLCDAQVSQWGNGVADSANELLWNLALMALSCADEAGHACTSTTRAGMVITCRLMPG